ncbi:MAG: hypothetical protein ACRDL3_07385 [Solirubrobacterales bacterium]
MPLAGLDGVEAANRRAIASAAERCLACRERFTNEWNAERIRAFVPPVLRRQP